MEAIFKTPLSVYVLFDRKYQNGMSVYEDIYHLLCRDAKRPLSDGLDIPVYCRINTDGNEIVCIDPIDQMLPQFQKIKEYTFVHLVLHSVRYYLYAI